MQFLCKIDQFERVFFTKPHLVAYYEKEKDKVGPGKKIQYFKEPQSYPINLNHGYEKYIEKELIPPSQNCVLDCNLKYATSLEFKESVKNLKKIKVFTRVGTLTQLLDCYYSEKGAISQIHVSRYNGDIYMVHRKTFYPTFRPVLTHAAHLLKIVFKGTFVVLLLFERK